MSDSLDLGWNVYGNEAEANCLIELPDTQLNMRINYVQTATNSTLPLNAEECRAREEFVNVR